MSTPKLPGICYLCGGVYAKRSMSQHLKACRKRHEPPADADRSGKAFRRRQGSPLHVVVESEWYVDYWLHLEVAPRATLQDVDALLRDLWLECCWHLSSFTIDGREYQSQVFEEDAYAWGDPPGSMEARAEAVLRPGTRFGYVYDFGSSTRLKGRVLQPLANALATHAVTLLARNEPPRIPCGCGNGEASQVCPQCMYGGEGWLCDACTETHDCGREYLLPVVNSPRVGVCAYTGD